MITENVEYEFSGFDPEQEIKTIVATVADKLYFSATSENPIRAIQRLEKRIKYQLDLWKLNRFERAL